jgi:lipid II:glycine glycyltransferase (peptidoglycan interpeptide bridge formation enzyme)
MHPRHATLSANVDDARAAQVDQFIAGARCSHFMQTRAWLTAFADSRESVGHCVTWHHDGSVSGCSGLRRVRGRGWLGEKCFVDGGPVFDSEDQLERHVADLVVATKAASYVRIRPYLPAAKSSRLRELLGDHAFQMLPPERQSGYATTLVLDLSRTSESLYSDFSTGLKRNLRKAARIGVAVESVAYVATIAEFAGLLGHAAAVAEYDVPPAEHVAQYLNSVLRADARSGALFCARIDGKLRAGIAVLRAGQSVVYQWGARSDPDAQGDLPLAHALHWEAINWARAQGFSQYDFGGLSEGPEPNGIDRFKEAFGGERQPMFGEAIRARGFVQRAASNRAGRFMARIVAAATRRTARRATREGKP